MNVYIHYVCTYSCTYVRTCMCICIHLTIVFHIVAYCSQGCYNGGNCTSPYVCTCSTGWTGGDCKIGLYTNARMYVQ